MGNSDSKHLGLKYTDLQPCVLKELTAYLAMLPGIGVKTATRLAYHLILDFPETEKQQLGNLIANLSKNYKVCSFCNVISNTNPCPVCADTSRDNTRILLLASSLDVYKVEKTCVYNGLYYVLTETSKTNSYANSLDKDESDIFIKKDRLKHLLKRICFLTDKLKNGEVLEIIFGLPVDVNSQGILHTIKEEVSKKCTKKVKITRLAVGLSIGADIEFVDAHTLGLAIKERQEIED